jgi:hypothetical protein
LTSYKADSHIICVPQTSREFSLSVKPMQPKQRRALWLEKTKKACGRNKIKDSAAAGFGDFIARFLAPHACHPGKIPVSTIPAFLGKYSKSEKQAKFCRDAILFFYTNVVPSENHCDFINNRTSKPQPNKAPTPVLPSGKAEVTAKIQNAPLPQAEKAASTTVEPIADHLKRMHVELKARNYSRRTIKNYSAAVNQYLLWLKKEPSA